jgi:hypothetical protein
LSINRFTATEEVSKTLRTEAAPHIVVETFNGAIEVLTGAEGKVKATVTKRAGGKTQEGAEDDLDNIDVSIEREKDVIHIVAVPRDHDAFRNRGASVELEVPAGAVLELTTSNAKISATGEVGDFTADSSNGGIHVEGSNGKLKLHTSNAGITVKGGGRLDLKTSNGPIAITTHKALVDAQISNSSIHFEVVENHLVVAGSTFLSDNAIY